MRIRDIREDEKGLLQEMMEDFYGNTGACLHPMDLEHMENTFALCLKENPYARLLMIEEEEKVLGFLLLSFTWSNEVGGMVVLLEELYFKKEARGKGLGCQAMAWLEEEYPQARRFRLEVTEGNQRAIRLYERMGYEDLPYRQMVKDRRIE